MGKKNVLIGVRVEEELATILKDLAKDQDRSISYITRNLLTQVLITEGLLKADKFSKNNGIKNHS